MFETIIDNFLYLVKERPELFANHQADLDHLVQTLPTNAEDTADAISWWIETHPSLEHPFLECLQEGKPRGFVSDKTAAADPKRDYGELVRNVVRESLPSQAHPPQKPAPKDEQTPPV
jgi:hypothetical protein